MSIRLGCLAFSAFFTEEEVTVDESIGTVNICVESSLLTIRDVEFSVLAHNGTAIGNRMLYTMQATLMNRVHFYYLSR